MYSKGETHGILRPVWRLLDNSIRYVLGELSVYIQTLIDYRTVVKRFILSEVHNYGLLILSNFV